MVIKTIKFQKASNCACILTSRLRTCRVVDLKLPITLHTHDTRRSSNCSKDFQNFQKISDHRRKDHGRRNATDLMQVVDFTGLVRDFHQVTSSLLASSSCMNL